MNKSSILFNLMEISNRTGTLLRDVTLFIAIRYLFNFHKCTYNSTQLVWKIPYLHVSHFSNACKTEGENEISRLISALCVNCLSVIPEYSRVILNSQVSFKLSKIPLIQFSNIPENFRMLSTQESGCASGTDHFRT